MVESDNALASDFSLLLAHNVNYLIWIPFIEKWIIPKIVLKMTENFLLLMIESTFVDDGTGRIICTYLHTTIFSQSEKASHLGILH